MTGEGGFSPFPVCDFLKCENDLGEQHLSYSENPDEISAAFEALAQKIRGEDLDGEAGQIVKELLRWGRDRSYDAITVQDFHGHILMRAEREPAVEEEAAPAL